MAKKELNYMSNAPRPPHKKVYKWEIKDSTRGYWFITARYSGQKESGTEPDFYESFWGVKVRTSPCTPKCAMDFIVQTQYDLPPSLSDIWREIQEHMMLLTEAMLLRQGIEISQ